MKILYIECNMGAAGDMLMSALLELHPNQEDFIKRLNSLNIPNICVEKETDKKCGIIGTHIKVTVGGIEENEHIHSHNYSHIHNSLNDIEHIINHLDLSENIREDVKNVYKIIAEAEGNVHNCEMNNIHFHEVGTMDAVADIVGVCMLIDELGADKIFASPVNVGSGQVKCAHGILPVPAPATACILRNVPIYSNNIKGELCTPTGAALLKYFVSEFREIPVMKVNKIGYGLGSKDFETANCVRIFIGETDDSMDSVTELMCNLDDMTGERIGFAVDRLFEAGALDVFTVPIGMKKGRPGILLTCICKKYDKEKMINLIFKYTSTIGVRENLLNRYLDRDEKIMQTKYGAVKVKVSNGYGVRKIKVEYDELERIAKENDIDISDIELK